MRATTARVALVVLLVCGGALGACGGEDKAGDGSRDGGGEAPSAPAERTFADDRFGFTFRYPGELREAEVTRAAAGDAPLARTALGLDSENLLAVQKYETSVPVTEGNLPQAVEELNAKVSELSGKPAAGVIVVVGGFPGVRYDQVDVPEPRDGLSRLVFLFDQTTQYQINCQSTPARRIRIDQVCDQVLTTLQRR